MKFKNFLLGAILMVTGILMIAVPETCIKTIVIMIGAATAVNGIYTLINFYKLSDDKIYKRTVLIKCLSSVIVGIIAVLFPLLLMKTVAAIWTVITVILAIYFILFAVAGFFSSSLIRDLPDEEKKRITQESFIYLLIAVVLFIIPIGKIISTLFRIAGIAGTVIGVVIIIREIITVSMKKGADKAIAEAEKSGSDDIVEK
ncbi:MAG: DUF308 domain-containing protein [Treponema sp.]|nr:DUF308 domain-containing protein [Treponema sp.]